MATTRQAGFSNEARRTKRPIRPKLVEIKESTIKNGASKIIGNLPVNTEKSQRFRASRVHIAISFRGWRVVWSGWKFIDFRRLSEHERTSEIMIKAEKNTNLFESFIIRWTGFTDVNLKEYRSEWGRLHEFFASPGQDQWRGSFPTLWAQLCFQKRWQMQILAILHQEF